MAATRAVCIVEFSQVTDTYVFGIT